ncbi:unnamed protein product [Thelazia callipaeda]|uniref:Peptidase_M1_N domain-containing protein n=1 Tax=Thelazia callipaeda TaxID=103827 RepID=A0A0N5D759_THECL|nr:unnamed protein product [Thelazia callipaeda]
MKVYYQRINFSFEAKILLILIVFLAFIVLFIVLLIISSRQRFERQVTLNKRNSSAKSDAVISGQYFRLPTTIRPIYYDLKLQIFLPYTENLDFGEKNFTTEASVMIRISCSHATDRIVLNAKKLKIDKNEIRVLRENDNSSISVLSIDRYQHGVSDIHVIEIRLKQMLKSALNYVVYINYRGIISDVWSGGLYKTEYDFNGQTR